MAKDDSEGEAADGESGGNPNKKLIIMFAIGALALVLLTGLTVYLVMSNGGEKEPEQAEQTEDGKPKEVDEDGNPLPALYYPIKPPFLATPWSSTTC